MVACIDEHQAAYGVEPICAVLPIAPSTYYLAKVRAADPTTRSARTQRDERLRPEIQRVYDEQQQVYGAKKVWKQLRREQIVVARCTVARLMQGMGLRGVVRGRRRWTTVPGDAAERPLDLVERQFVATRPNQLRVSDLTYVATWRGFAVRCVRDRRVLAADCWLASPQFVAQRSRARCLRASDLRT